MTCYIVGKVGALRVYSTEPAEAKYPKGERGPHYGWEGGYFWFPVKRNILQEWSDKPRIFGGNGIPRIQVGTSGKVYARVMPADVESEVVQLDTQIAETEALLKRLRTERQDLLHAAAQRGERVRVGAKAPLPCCGEYGTGSGMHGEDCENYQP